jgi:hypothetical protein
MNLSKGSSDKEKLNINALLELLSHNETNYAFFAVSRIKVISKIIGINIKISRTKKNNR